MSDTPDLSLEETAQRFRHSSRNHIEWTTPSPDSWAAISSALGFATPGGPANAETPAGPSFVGTASAAAPAEPTAPGPIPPSSPATPPGHARRTIITGLGGVLVGAALGAGAMRLGRTEPSSGVPVRRAVLTPLEREDEKLGVAELRPAGNGYTLTVDVPRGIKHPGGYIEVWLINTNLSPLRMVSVGVFAAGSDAEFHVDADLIDQGYLIVDLSNEEFDTEPRHSGDTIMRGTLLS